jgi:hypothetical protein
MIKVNIKWRKNIYKEVSIDLESEISKLKCIKTDDYT